MPPRPRRGKKEKPKDAKGTLLRILKYIMDYRLAVLLLLVCTFASNIGNLLGPTFAGEAHDAADEQHREHQRGGRQTAAEI